MSAEPTESTLEPEAPTFQETLEAATPRIFITPALIGINLVVLVVASFGGVSPFSATASQVLPWGANYGPLTEHGQWWRLLTACFLHFGFIHFGMNMFALLQAGVLTERLFGNARFLVLYLFAGLVGNVAGLYVHPMVVAAGASGAVFGVYGALLSYVLSRRDAVPSKVLVGILKFAGIFVVYNVVYGMAHSEVDMVAHLGGLISGYIAGAVLAQPLSPPEERSQPLQTVAITTGLFALIVGGAYFVPKQKVNADDLSTQLLIGPSVQAGVNGKVIYINGATKDDAQHVATALVKQGLFSKPGAYMTVSRDHDGAILSFPFRETALTAPVWENPTAVTGFAIIGVEVAPDVGGPPMKIRFLNQKGELKRELQIDSREIRVGTRDRIWYSGGVSEENATQLGEALKKIGFFKDNSGLVQVSKGASGTELSYLVKDSVFLDPKMELGFQVITREVARSVGGLPITVHLIDRTLQPQKTFQVK